MIRVAKDATPTSRPEPGGTFTFKVTVSNLTGEQVVISSITDDKHGDLNGKGTCDSGAVLAANTSYVCEFDAEFTGVAGDSETDIVTVTVVDDEGTSSSAQGDATVTITAAGDRGSDDHRQQHQRRDLHEQRHHHGKLGSVPHRPGQHQQQQLVRLVGDGHRRCDGCEAHAHSGGGRTAEDPGENRAGDGPADCPGGGPDGARLPVDEGQPQAEAGGQRRLTPRVEHWKE